MTRYLDIGRRAVRWVPVIGVVLGLGITGVGASSAHAAKAPKRSAVERYSWVLPKGFPQPRVPRTNPMTQQKVNLGRFLFYDNRLSGNRRQSCASCHHQSKAFTDGRATAVGSTGEVLPRGAQSLANVAYNATLTWANPSLVTLEKQMEVPLFAHDPVELGITDRNKAAVLARFRRDRAYRLRFARAFPRQRQPVTWKNIVHSIAAFQRTMISGDSRYDRYLRGKARLSASELRGANLFFGERAECHHCHGGFNFTNQVSYVGAQRTRPAFHNTGLFNIGGTGAFPEPNRGVFELTGRPQDMGAFRAPTLRNIAVTAPYMHDGSLATLQDVVNFYAEGGRNITTGPNAGDGRANPFRDSLTVGFDLDEGEKADLVAFLRTLTDRRFLTRRDLSDPFRRVR